MIDIYNLTDQLKTNNFIDIEYNNEEQDKLNKLKNLLFENLSNGSNAGRYKIINFDSYNRIKNITQEENLIAILFKDYKEVLSTITVKESTLALEITRQFQTIISSLFMISGKQSYKSSDDLESLLNLTNMISSNENITKLFNLLKEFYNVEYLLIWIDIPNEENNIFNILNQLDTKNIKVINCKYTILFKAENYF